MHGITSATHSPTDLCAQYRSIRAHTEYLCQPLEIEDYIPQPSVDVSPAKWNIAHTTWFFEEMVLKNHLEGYRPFDPTFSFLFNSYYNSIGDRTDRDARGDLSRPTVAKVFEYRQFVDEHMSALLSNNDNQDLKDLTTLGLNHEQQHQELLISDLKFTFGVNPLSPVYRTEYFPEEDPEDHTGAGLISIPGGTYEIGYSGHGFCFDNELALHIQYVRDFRIADRLITNEEYLEFMISGGYKEHSLWHSEGWDWINQNSIDSPHYWQRQNGEWHAFTLGGLRPLALEAPVCHVSFYEASAFAEWRGMRLPTEFEWEVASDQLDWGRRWEWTNSAYLPYPGFNKRQGAIGEYNGKFMINQMVLRGASIATPMGHSRPTYRNFFHPHLRWQFTGIRLAD
jgi:ergothioneine biosynthesis protein EgtB